MLQSNLVLASSGVAFGTSGARGLVTDFTPNVCAAFTHAFVEVMRSSCSSPITQIAIGIDNRPSSYGMAMACSEALRQSGIDVVYYGVLPTPALAYVAMSDNMPCIMVTGSHIPFDRNGLKFYRPDGEITKADELGILSATVKFESLEDCDLSSLMSDTSAAERYIRRYTALYPANCLSGKRIGIYQHSSSGRDLYPALFSSLGAEVICLERSNEFVPIDTEAVSVADQQKAKTWSNEYGFDAIFSTDGDGDRPLIADEKGQWLRGDILGLLCAKGLGIEALAVPVSCNTAIELSASFKEVVRTRIGSPYVIAAFADLMKTHTTVAGFEANGGFLLASDLTINDGFLSALPTRDAVLPAIILLTLTANSAVSDLVSALPQRFSASDRIKDFATERSQQIIQQGLQNPEALLTALGFIMQGENALQLVDVNSTDGLRMTLSNRVVVHLRPSGNAPELRCYIEANSPLDATNLAAKVLSCIAGIDFNTQI